MVPWYTITSTLEGGGVSAVLHIDMALGPIGPTPSSLLTKMSSSNMAIFRTRPYFLVPWTGAILIRVKSRPLFG
jgi:hypothetical protein